MKSLYLTIIVVFLSIATFAQQKAKQDPIDAALDKCLSKPENQNTASTCNCTYEALDKWDKKLNATYKTLLANLKEPARTKLVEAQREWVKFKEKETELLKATYGSANGTMWRIVNADKFLDLTRSRALDLEALLDVLDEF
ncbi:lysozyme inhibitor LprI family protein [Chitinophagaceae bacterium MMS25-I14]